MLYLFITTNILISQNLFAKAYGGTDSDFARSIIQTTDGGYAVAGLTWSFGAGNEDFLILNLASDGSLQWAKTFGGINRDYARSIIQTTDGGYAITGFTHSFGAGQYDLIVLKLASDGSLGWAKTFGGPDYDWGHSIIQTGDGGYVIAGHTSSFGAGNDDLLVLKTTSDGSLEWAKTFGGPDYDWAYSIIRTTDGGYVVVGDTKSFGAGDNDVIMLKLASDGSFEWAKTFGGSLGDFARSIIQTTDGGYALVGYTGSSGAGQYDLFLLKTTSDGSLEWAKTFGGPDYDRAYSIIQTADGGYAVGGYTISFGAGSDDLIILKTTSDGSFEWAKTFGGTDYDETRSIMQASDSTYVIAGYTESFGAGSGAFLVIKIDQDGNYPGCIQDCNPTSEDFSPDVSSVSLGVDCSPTVNTPNVSMSSPNITTEDICPQGDVGESDSRRQKPGIICSALPGSAVFTAREAVSLKIYQADGRLVYSVNLKRGQNKIELDTGVYFWAAGLYRGKAIVR